MPLGMICQGALKYRSSATVVEWETQHVQPLLEVAVQKAVAVRLVEVRVEGADDRAVGFLNREEREDRREGRVDVDDVVLPLAQDLAHLLP